MAHSKRAPFSFFFFTIIFFLLIWSIFIMEITNGVLIPNVTVAQDGSGNYKTVTEAVLAAPDRNMQRYVILVKKGVYSEKVFINAVKWNIMLIGEGMQSTIITGSMGCRGNKSNACTYASATFTVLGQGFVAQDISFKNTAGAANGQAVALKSDSEFSVFYRVGIYGYQDSLCANLNRQFYKECTISGTVDFIFGYASAIFQNCQILVKKGASVQNTITAQAGLPGTTIATGFVFQFCSILADSDLLPSINSISTFFGRPWHPYSRVIVMRSHISDVLSPAGWLEWDGSPQNLDTLYYAEYRNYGLGANTKNRVKWSGYHLLNSDEANNFTVVNFLSGDQWLPSTRVPYIGGLGY